MRNTQKREKKSAPDLLSTSWQNNFDLGFLQGASQKKKKQGAKKQFAQKTTDRLSSFFFLGAPCVGCGPSVDMPPHVGTRSWLSGLPLRASYL
jgi:hypothetical protein